LFPKFASNGLQCVATFGNGALVMPALVAGIHGLDALEIKDVNGRDPAMTAIDTA
jgi:hypothetical protein